MCESYKGLNLNLFITEVNALLIHPNIFTQYPDLYRHASYLIAKIVQYPRSPNNKKTTKALKDFI